MGVPNYLTCLQRNLYAGQEATKLDREQLTGSKLGGGVPQDYMLSHAYLTSVQVTLGGILG